MRSNGTRLAAFALALLAHAASGQAPAPLAQKPVVALKTWGTTVESYSRMAAAEFTPLTSSTPYSDQFFPNAGAYYGRFSTAPGGQFVGSPSLPSGARVTYLELDSCDFSDTSNVTASLWPCDYTGGGCTNLGMQLNSAANTTPNACSYTSVDLSSYGIVVNNYGGQISILVETEAGDATTSLSGVVVGYKLQVAPPPASPTFNDVPISDIGFQFIEALAASGITGGCGGGSFCPDEPVKRRQMAIFLAKALGLYLPQY